MSQNIADRTSGAASVDGVPGPADKSAAERPDDRPRVLLRITEQLAAPSVSAGVAEFHRALLGYQPSELLSQPALAAELDVGDVKILGASWATVHALRARGLDGWHAADGLDPLRGRFAGVTVAAATDGNHGRALAHVARLLDLAAQIYVPAWLSADRVDGIRSEGASVVVIDGDYDVAVARCAEDSERAGWVLVSDTSWPGYEETPAAVIDGYATILNEIDRQREELRRGQPDVVVVPIGVGAFAAAVVRHYASAPNRPRILGVEPTGAACVMASLAAGARLALPGPHHSVMAGLNCGTPSYVAWPTLQAGLDAVVVVDDNEALDGVRRFADLGLAVGECSGAVLAAARLLTTGPHAPALRTHLAVDEQSSIVLLATEGVTDPTRHAAALGAATDAS